VKRNSNFEPVSKGLKEGVISKVERADDIISPYDDPTSPKEKLKIYFRLSDEIRDDGSPWEFSELYSNSLYEKSKLYLHLTGAGIDVHKVQDLEELIGIPVVINVGHRTSKQGGIFPQVLGLAPSTRQRKSNPEDPCPF
jgi:hypothetical protein